MSRFSTLQLAVVLGLITACAQLTMAQSQGFSAGFQSTTPGYPLGQSSGYSASGGQFSGGGYSGGGYGGQFSGGGYSAGGYAGQSAGPVAPVPAGPGCSQCGSGSTRSQYGSGGGCSQCGSGGGCSQCGSAGSHSPWMGCGVGHLCGKACAIHSYLSSRGCDMPLHYAYYPPMHGYYYFRPYHHSHIPLHQGIATRFGIDPRNPYSNDFFKLIYAEYRASQRGTAPEVAPEEVPALPGRSTLPTPARP